MLAGTTYKVGSARRLFHGLIKARWQWIWLAFLNMISVARPVADIKPCRQQTPVKPFKTFNGLQIRLAVVSPVTWQGHSSQPRQCLAIRGAVPSKTYYMMKGE